MTVFLLDISHWQGDNPDFARAKTEGISGAILKATQGGSFVDSRFAANLAKARSVGWLTAAYHFLDDRYTVADNVRNALNTIPAGVPIIPDAEYQHEGSRIVVRPSKAFTKEFIDKIKEAGRSVPLAYIPRWYWEGEWRSPSLAGFPPLWQSRYPDNRQGYYRAEWQEVVDHYPHFWEGFGGLGVTLLQFTSSGRVAGYGPLDVNAFRGTYAELTALLGGEVDDMFSDEDRKKLNEAWAKSDAVWSFFRAEAEGQKKGYLRELIQEIVQDTRETDARLSSYPTLADIVSEVKAVKAEVEQVKAGNIDYARLAKAVNDDAAKRLAA